MSEAEEVWRRRSDAQLVEASSRLDEYTDEGRRVIRAELVRRGLAVPAQTMHTYIVDVPGEGIQNIISVLSEHVVFATGLRPEAIVGKLIKQPAEGGTLSPQNFARNKRFVDFLHDVISRHGPNVPALIAEAKRLGHGRVYVIDGRTPTPHGDVPPDDIIGAFEVEGGRVSPGSYVRNPNHVLLSARGFFRLEPPLHERLLAELTDPDGQQSA